MIADMVYAQLTPLVGKDSRGPSGPRPLARWRRCRLAVEGVAGRFIKRLQGHDVIMAPS